MAQGNPPNQQPKNDATHGPIKSRAELKAFFTNGQLPDESAFASLIDSLVHRNDLWEKTASGDTDKNGVSRHKVTALNRSWYVYVDSQNNLVVSESDAV